MTDLFRGPAIEDVRIEDVIAEIERELAMRRYVYPRHVTNGKLSKLAMDQRILVLERILADYRGRL